MYTDDIKLFDKNEKEMETWMQAVRAHSQDIGMEFGIAHSQDIGMEFGIEKCAIKIMRSWKQQVKEGIEQPNQEKVRMLKEKETHSEILEMNTIK